ncbi:sigma-54-dependent Fis family transcriptional regulator [Aquiflexum lacus]|uniref:sigma-54-dependent Fis family transcriptional regulator n=1 Tax=Aquiflexum lacus TaxID=2483805 RepID=UPI00189546FE|nr:sigma 54-interacting transcriptional regulator [Aquiflexum lacus]
MKNEREKSILLEISKSISKVQNSKELWDTLIEYIEPLLSFKASVITLYNNDYTKFKYYLASGNFNQVSSFNIDSIMNKYFSFEGTSDLWVLNQGDVSMLSIDEREESGIYNRSRVALLKSMGITDNLYIKLKSRGKVIGVQHYHFSEPISEEKLKLAKSITELIAIGVDNIISKESIQEKENEKSKLLEISSGITLVKSTKDLVELIENKVKPIFPFDNIGLYLIDVVNDQMSEVFNDNITYDELQEGLKSKNLLGPWKLSESDPRSWWIKDYIVINQIEKELKFSIGKPWEEQFILGLEYGLKSFIGGPLVSQGQKIGAICFNSKADDFFHEDDKPLFKSISEQLATALSNILSHETILKKERESQLLIEVNELIATVKTPESLLEIIINKVKPFFNFHDCGLFVLDSKKDFHEDWAVDIIDLSPSDWNNMLRLKVQRYKQKDSPVEYILKRISEENSPVVIDFPDLIKLYPDYPQFTNFDVLGYGYRDCLGYHLKIDGEVRGFFCMNALKKDFFNPEDFSFFQSICHSISIAVKNILEHKQLVSKEKEKAMQVTFNNIFSAKIDWKEKWVGFGQEINKLIPFDLLIVQFNNQDENNTFVIEMIGFQEYRILEMQELLKILDINFSQFEALKKSIAIHPNGIFVENELQNLFVENPPIRFLSKLKKVNALMNSFIRLSPSKSYQFTILNSKEQILGQDHYECVTRILPTLKLCLEKSLAYDEIKQLSGRLELEKEYLMEEVQHGNNFGEIIGTSEAVMKTLKAIGKVAKTDSTVLIEGETGTGKELIARAIHQQSNRNDKPLIKVNCASLPPQLIESELFGHEKGSFTGATDRRIGKFELANKGTLFLDEIGELPLELQPKLLRALQEREIERVGGTGSISCDVRIVAATNRDLEVEVRKGTFRADLFYRLNVFPIVSTPLRNRKEDIADLCKYFSGKFAKKIGKHFEGFSKSSVEFLNNHSWPGNIRELQNVIEQAIITSEGKLIECNAYFKSRAKEKSQNSNGTHEVLSFGQNIVQMNEYLLELERNHILETLKNTKYRIRGEGGAAEILDIHPNTLESKLKKLGISKRYV